LPKTIIIFITVLFCFSAVLVAETDLSRNSQPVSFDKIADLSGIQPNPDGVPLSSPLAPTDDPIGDVFVLGTTWYDIQHNSTCGHQIQIDNEGWIHAVWMNGLDNAAANRHIYYQLINPSDSLFFVGGVQVDQYPRAGYTDLVVTSDNRAFPIYHRNQDATYWFTNTAYDFFPHFGAFSSLEAPHVYSGDELSVGWPKASTDGNDRIHIISTENPLSGVAGDPQRQYYISGQYNPGTFSFEYNGSQELIAWTMTISGQVASSPVSDRVAIAYLQPWTTDPSDTTQHDNDVVLVISEDGETWDWADTINVTNWIEPDPSFLPDTARANKDTLRCYAEIDVIFDYNDVLHVFFTTEWYNHYAGTISLGNGFIWHWDEMNQVYSMVANGYFENGFVDPGAWNTYTTRPQAGIDETTGDIYCMYQRYMNPIEYSQTFPFPYMVGDTADVSSTGWPNGDIWITKSTDGGYTWAEGTNITQTRTPGAPANECLSELTPSMAPQVTGGNCHVFYVLDRDAGTPVQNEGVWTLNDMIYQRVPVGLIAEEPVLPPYPMHCDSTGMPDTLNVRNVSPGYQPAEFSLNPAYPNPFNPGTNLRFNLPKAAEISLIIYDISGREVAILAEGFRAAGAYEATFNAVELSSGIYFARLKTAGYAQTQKLVLIK